MASREDPAPKPDRTTTALAAGVAFGAFGMFLVAMFVQTPAPDAPPPPVIRPSPAVITSIRELSRLETATAHVERIIELTDSQETLFGLVRTEDTMLLVAAADVTAGVDLSTLEDGAVVVDAATGSVTITLPRSTVLTTAVDEEHTYVHSRATDLLAERREDLETLARREASTSLESAAVEGGLLDRADASAARTVEALVRSLGHEHVTIRRAD